MSTTKINGPIYKTAWQDKPVDDLGVRVLAGICENLYGRQLYEAGAKLAERMVYSGRVTDKDLHQEVGWACMVPALFHTGDFLSMFDYMDKILAVYFLPNPKPQTLNPKPYTLHPKPKTLNPKTYTLNPKPSTLKPTP
ncbi:hypothetical protein T484DRAFT_2753306 [Baffinella frigidus]|nr:hypothetical protein T484DRAFT_2753306 [Cryptophyta sp. CCMP2293]